MDEKTVKIENVEEQIHNLRKITTIYKSGYGDLKGVVLNSESAEYIATILESAKGMICITEKRLKELEDDEAELAALHAGGVDNWDWYHDSLKDAGLLDLEEER